MRIPPLLLILLLSTACVEQPRPQASKKTVEDKARADIWVELTTKADALYAQSEHGEAFDLAFSIIDSTYIPKPVEAWPYFAGYFSDMEQWRLNYKHPEKQRLTKEEAPAFYLEKMQKEYPTRILSDSISSSAIHATIKIRPSPQLEARYHQRPMLSGGILRPAETDSMPYKLLDLSALLESVQENTIYYPSQASLSDEERMFWLDAALFIGSFSLKNRQKMNTIDVSDIQREMAKKHRWLVPTKGVHPDSPYFKSLQSALLAGWYVPGEWKEDHFVVDFEDFNNTKWLRMLWSASISKSPSSLRGRLTREKALMAVWEAQGRPIDDNEQLFRDVRAPNELYTALSYYKTKLEEHPWFDSTRFRAKLTADALDCLLLLDMAFEPLEKQAFE